MHIGTQGRRRSRIVSGHGQNSNYICNLGHIHCLSGDSRAQSGESDRNAPLPACAYVQAACRGRMIFQTGQQLITDGLLWQSAVLRDIIEQRLTITYSPNSNIDL